LAVHPLTAGFTLIDSDSTYHAKCFL